MNFMDIVRNLLGAVVVILIVGVAVSIIFGLLTIFLLVAALLLPFIGIGLLCIASIIIFAAVLSP